MTTIRFNDTIQAREGTVTAIFAEGRIGVVVETPGPTGRGLVRWGDETIFMGFHTENVELVHATPAALEA